MAGGIGKRMNSDLPKVLHLVSSPSESEMLPMIVHAIRTANQLNPSKIFVIVGKHRKRISDTIDHYAKSGWIQCLDSIHYIDQEPALGTGHAVRCVLPYIEEYKEDSAIILSGDVPLLSQNTLLRICGGENRLLITELDEPFGCGRILFDQQNRILGIKEEKDCTPEEQKIQFVNCGIYQIRVSHLMEWIPLIQNNNNAEEYYLTDIVGLLLKNRIPIETIVLEKTQQWEIKNINTQRDLEEINDFVLYFLRDKSLRF